MVGPQWHSSTTLHWRTPSSSTSPPMTASTACATPQRTSTGKLMSLRLHLMFLYQNATFACWCWFGSQSLASFSYTFFNEYRGGVPLSPTPSSMNTEVVCLHEVQCADCHDVRSNTSSTTSWGLQRVLTWHRAVCCHRQTCISGLDLVWQWPSFLPVLFCLDAFCNSCWHVQL